jgi:hypothetical protein
MVAVRAPQHLSMKLLPFQPTPLNPSAWIATPEHDVLRQLELDTHSVQQATARAVCKFVLQWPGKIESTERQDAQAAQVITYRVRHYYVVASVNWCFFLSFKSRFLPW